jgi:hypothetical protein
MNLSPASPPVSLVVLYGRGVERIADLFERDLQNVPVEVAIALLRYLRASFGITTAGML